MRDLADTHYVEAELTRVVLDNFSTHTARALQETFPAPKAPRIVQRLEFHHLLKHAICAGANNCRICCTCKAALPDIMSLPDPRTTMRGAVR